MWRRRRERQIEQSLEGRVNIKRSYAARITNLEPLLDGWIIELMSQAIMDQLCGSIEIRKISALFHLRETMGKINGNQRECRQQEKILRQVRHSRSDRPRRLISHVRAVYPKCSQLCHLICCHTCIGSDDGLGFSNALASPVCRRVQDELEDRNARGGRCDNCFLSRPHHVRGRSHFSAGDPQESPKFQPAHRVESRWGDLC